MAVLFAGRQVVVVMVGMALFFGLLWLPVLGDRAKAAVGRNAPQVAPRIFVLGLGILIAGLALRAWVLDAVGASVIGALVLTAILYNY